MSEFDKGPVAGVGAVVWKGGAVLLVKRANPPRAGSWSLPGGKQHAGETVDEAASREVREETGVEIDIIGVAAVVDLMDRDADGHLLYHFLVVDMVAEWAGGDAVAGDDAAAVLWADPRQFAELNLTADVLRVIDAARAKRHLEQGLP